MIYRVVYDDQFFRTIPACMIDSRVGAPLANATGAQMETYIQPMVEQIVPGVLPYKIETINGNLVGVFALEVGQGGYSVIFSIIRSGFQADIVNVNAEIGSFVASNNWVYDM